jgi:hypothetical protein
MHHDDWQEKKSNAVGSGAASNNWKQRGKKKNKEGNKGRVGW